VAKYQCVMASKAMKSESGSEEKESVAKTETAKEMA
jgi:hypothetical protein